MLDRTSVPIDADSVSGDNKEDVSPQLGRYVKTVLIAKSSASPWVSCQSITANLLRAYQSEQKAVELIHFDEGDSFWKTSQEVEACLAKGIERFVFLDHHPHPRLFIQALHSLTTSQQRPELVFHLFGDFTLFATQWEACSSILEDFPVRFFCASPNQARLVSSCLATGDKSVEVLPFAVDEKRFAFDEIKRQQFRNSLSFKENTKVLLYTGRLSLQKNVIELVKAFDSLRSVFEGEDVHLCLAGGFDDLNLPFVGKSGLAGSFFHLWHQETQAAFSRGHIHLLGQLNGADLVNAYQGADYFISLSTHNDEDYGMSPAEAHLCGLPLLLTGWGGYPNFKTDDHVDLVPIDFSNESRTVPQMRDVQKKMTKLLLKEPHCDEQRKEISLARLNDFSLLPVAQRLQSLLKQKAFQFSGFNAHFFKLCSFFKANSEAPFANSSGGHNDFYREFYSVYVNQERSWKK